VVARGDAATNAHERAGGKSGGIRLLVEPKALRLGAVVRALEPELGLVA